MKSECLNNHNSRKRHCLWNSTLPRCAGMATVAAVATMLFAGCGGPPPGRGAMSVPVEAVQVSHAPIEDRISLVATISANESVEVRSEIDGTVEAVAFDEGQPVEAGQLLIQLDQRKLAAQVAEAQASFSLAEANQARAESLFKNRTISQQEFDQARSSFDVRKAALELVQQQMKDTRILAPFQGITRSRLVSPGQVIGRNAPLTSVVDITPVKIDFHVPERYLGELSVGQTITFRVPAYPDTDFRGDVYFIDPQVDETTRTLLVKALQPNSDGRLRPGMFGNLDLILRVKDDALLLPEKCLVLQGEHKYIYRIAAESKAERIEVKTGVRTDGMVEITSGITVGDTIIIEGLQKVQPGATVSTNVPGSVKLPPANENP